MQGDRDNDTRFPRTFSIAEKEVPWLFGLDDATVDFTGAFFVLVTVGGVTSARPVEKGDWTVDIANRGGAELMRCQVCGKLFNPGRLDEVVVHEHNDDRGPGDFEYDGEKVD